MAESVVGPDAHPAAGVSIPLRRSEEGGPPPPASGGETQRHASGRKDLWWDMAKGFVSGAGWSALAVGNGMSDPIKQAVGQAVGLGFLAGQNAVKVAQNYSTDSQTAAINAAAFAGHILWGAGVGAGNTVGKVMGPATNAVASLTSAGLRYYQGKEGWVRDLVGASEGVAFMTSSLPGVDPTGVRVARTVAFVNLASGLFLDAKHDKAFVKHSKALVAGGIGAAGAITWGLGAALEKGTPASNALQSAGAGIITVAQAVRLGLLLREHLTQRSSPAVDLEQPDYQPAPASESTSPVPLNPIVAAQIAAPATSGVPLSELPRPLLEVPSPLLPAVTSQTPPATPGPLLPEPSSPFLSAVTGQTPPVTPDPFSSTPQPVPPVAAHLYAPPLPAPTPDSEADGDRSARSRPGSAPVQTPASPRAASPRAPERAARRASR